jgi:SAM-dependent methyltransferase
MFDGRYLEWNQKRIKAIIDYYGHPFFAQKRVLDLGCGHADVSGALFRLGADITAVDARQEHLKIAQKKYQGIKVVRADLDHNWPFANKEFDIVLDLDLICHLADYEQHIRQICSVANHVILETAVMDVLDNTKSIVLPENKNVYDLSVNGVSCRPTASAIERVLLECGFTFKRVDAAKFNSGSYVYDWRENNDESCDINHRRIWFASKASLAVGKPTTSPFKVDLKLPDMSSRYAGKIQEGRPAPLSYNPKTIKIPNKRLKIALCISGHLRTYEDNFKSVYDHILSKHDCDVFIHTWDSLGLSYRHTDAGLHLFNTENFRSKIEFLYNPKKLVIEPNRHFEITPLMQKRLIDHRDISGIVSMIYKIEACNKLKQEYESENNFKYDLVVRFRGDLFVETPLPTDSISNFDSLFLPFHGNFAGINDQFAFGSSAIMDKYSSLYSNLEEYLQAGAYMHPEKIFQYNVDVNKIPIAKVNFRYVIRRANGLVQDNYLLERALGFIK